MQDTVYLIASLVALSRGAVPTRGEKRAEMCPRVRPLSDNGGPWSAPPRMRFYVILYLGPVFVRPIFFTSYNSLLWYLLNLNQSYDIMAHKFVTNVNGIIY